MFVEVDDGKFVNLENVFAVTFEPANNKGCWLFRGPAISQASSHAATYKELQIRSRQFDNKEQALDWLKSAISGYAAPGGEVPRSR